MDYQSHHQTSDPDFMVYQARLQSTLSYLATWSEIAKGTSSAKTAPPKPDLSSLPPARFPSAIKAMTLVSKVAVTFAAALEQLELEKSKTITNGTPSVQPSGSETAQAEGAAPTAPTESTSTPTTTNGHASQDTASVAPTTEVEPKMASPRVESQERSLMDIQSQAPSGTLPPEVISSQRSESVLSPVNGQIVLGRANVQESPGDSSASASQDQPWEPTVSTSATATFATSSSPVFPNAAESFVVATTEAVTKSPTSLHNRNEPVTNTASVFVPSSSAAPIASLNGVSTAHPRAGSIPSSPAITQPPTPAALGVLSGSMASPGQPTGTALFSPPFPLPGIKAGPVMGGSITSSPLVSHQSLPPRTMPGSVVSSPLLAQRAASQPPLQQQQQHQDTHPHRSATLPSSPLSAVNPASANMVSSAPATPTAAFHAATTSAATAAATVPAPSQTTMMPSAYPKPTTPGIMPSAQNVVPPGGVVMAGPMMMQPRPAMQGVQAFPMSEMQPLMGQPTMGQPIGPTGQVMGPMGVPNSIPGAGPLQGRRMIGPNGVQMQLGAHPQHQLHPFQLHMMQPSQQQANLYPNQLHQQQQLQQQQQQQQWQNQQLQQQWQSQPMLQQQQQLPPQQQQQQQRASRQNSPMISPGLSSPAMFSPPPLTPGLSGGMSRAMSQGLSSAGSMDAGSGHSLPTTGIAATSLVSQSAPILPSNLGSPLLLQQQQQQQYRSPSLNSEMARFPSSSPANLEQNPKGDVGSKGTPAGSGHDPSSSFGGADSGHHDNSDDLMDGGDGDDGSMTGLEVDIAGSEAHSYDEQGYGGNHSTSQNKVHDMGSLSVEHQEEEDDAGLGHLEMQEEDEDDVMNGFLNL
ncbi:hypothetical protein BGX34_000921 [Mortierella sp. NVP85]|nr:hypothetical protein BGX34_000921 [Mortierella sp. NVP85]